MCILCSHQLLRLCAFNFHDTEQLITPAVYLILPESVWVGYSHLVQRGFFSLWCTHLQTGACTMTIFLGGRLLATERTAVTRNGEKVKIWFPNEEQGDC